MSIPEEPERYVEHYQDGEPAPRADWLFWGVVMGLVGVLGLVFWGES